MHNYPKITIGDDPFSLTFLNYVKKLERYKTCLEWKTNINIPMKETTYWKSFKSILDNKGTIWNGIINNEKELEKQYNNFKEMFIVAPNWKPSGLEKIIQKGEYFYGDMPCKIKNNGDIHLFDGWHRVSISVANKWPIKLSLCSKEPEWKKLTEEIKELYPSGSLYQKFNHPEFINAKCSHDKIQEQLVRTIVSNLKIQSVIDCGICHGDTLYQLRDLIEKGIGIEYNEIRYKMSKIIYDKIKFKTVNSNFVNFFNGTQPKVDAIFCLNVLHHTMKECKKDDFISLLKQMSISCSHFLYSLPEEREFQFEWMYKEDVHKLIQDTLGFQNKNVYQMQVRKLWVISK